MKNISKTLLLIAAFNLVLLCLVSCQGGNKTTTGAQAPTSPDTSESVVSFVPLPTESTTPTVVPPSDPETPTVTPSVTPSVSPSVPVSPTESETVSPTLTPKPSTSTPDGFKTINASGTFLSDTGTKLNLSVDWKIETLEDLTYQITMDVYLDSYSLYCNKRESGNIITVGQYELPYTTDAMAFDADSGKHHTLLTSVEIVYTPDMMPEELELGATWKFNGSYSKVEIGIIEAKTVIKIAELD